MCAIQRVKGQDKRFTLSTFELGMVVGARRTSVSRTATLLGFSHSTVSRVYQDGPPPKGHPANLIQQWEALESTWASIPVEHLTPFRVHALTNRGRSRAEVGATQYQKGDACLGSG
jgi:hypothetical protein